jgi:hypothetical protein
MITDNISNNKRKFLYDKMFGHLPDEDVITIAKIFEKQNRNQHDDFDFTKPDTTPTKLKKTRKLEDGVLPFSEMKKDLGRSIEERQSTLWRRSCEYWLRKFQEMREPVCLYWTMHYKPGAFTVYIRDVQPEMVHIVKIASDKDISEKSWKYQYVYGIEIPDNKFRKKAKKRMHEYYSCPLNDTEEFLKFRETQVRLALKANKQVPEKMVSDLPKEIIGERYERQLEWHYNMQGYHVDTNGLKKTTEDGGVDHILVKNGKVDLIQAKALGKSNKLAVYDIETIRNQMQDFYEKNKANTDLLPGSLNRLVLVVANGESVGEEARKKAAEIGMALEIVPYKDDWPCIKCVFSSKGEKRYYQPTDQHWMGCNMLADRRRFWAYSVEEAQSKGYKPSKARSR